MRSLPILVALAVIAVAVVLVDRRPSTPDQRREERHLLPGFSADAVTGLVLVRPQSVVTLARDSAGWQLDGLQVDLAAVDALLGSVQFASVQRWVATGPGPIRLELRLIGKTPHRLRIGSDDASGLMVYVAVDDRAEVAVVEKRLLALADVSASAFISRTLTVADAGRARRLTVGAWTLDREGALGDARWADADKAAAAWHAIETARAVEVLPSDAATPNTLAILLDGHPEAALGAACGANRTEVRRVDGARLCFENHALAPLRHSADTLADPRLFPVALDDIQAATFANHALRHENGRWLLGNTQLDDHKVRAWLSSLLLLKRPDVDSVYIVTLTARNRTVSGAVGSLPDPLTLGR